MQVKIIKFETKEGFNAIFKYKVENIDGEFSRSLNFTTNSSKYFDEILKTWVDLCDKKYFNSGQIMLLNPVFWNDSTNTNYICTTFSPYDNKVIRIPFDECIEAFKKVRDEYYKMMLEHINDKISQLTEMKKSVEDVYTTSQN